MWISILTKNSLVILNKFNNSFHTLHSCTGATKIKSMQKWKVIDIALKAKLLAHFKNNTLSAYFVHLISVKECEGHPSRKNNGYSDISFRIYMYWHWYRFLETRSFRKLSYFLNSRASKILKITFLELYFLNSKQLR